MNGPNNNIGWCDYTWNPITGCLGNKESGCYEYCYARALYKRFGWSFKPTFHQNRIKEPSKVKEPSRIFVCSVADIFAKSTKPSWRGIIFDKIYTEPQHTFIILTKCPENIPPLPFDDNVWIGTTVTKQSEYNRIRTIADIQAKVRFVSFEPMFEELDLRSEPPLYDLINWAIIGSQTGPNAKPTKPEWVTLFIKKYGEKLPIYLKDNLNYPEKRKEFP